MEPRVVCTLGNFATKLLRGDNAPITQLHGRPELITLGGRTVYLLPLFHPEAALYTRALLDTLRDDLAGLPGTPGPNGAPSARTGTTAEAAPEPEADSAQETGDGGPEPPEQLGLF